MSDKYKNLTSEELTKAFEKLGIVRMTDRIESAEDPNIRFSKFDTCYVSGVEYVDRVSESRRYERLSDTFERAFKVLEDYCYENITFLSSDMRYFTHYFRTTLF